VTYTKSFEIGTGSGVSVLDAVEVGGGKNGGESRRRSIVESREEKQARERERLLLKKKPAKGPDPQRRTKREEEIPHSHSITELAIKEHLKGERITEREETRKGGRKMHIKPPGNSTNGSQSQ